MGLFEISKYFKVSAIAQGTSANLIMLVSRIILGLQRSADNATKAWSTNYVKGTVWFGCKMPVVRAVVKEALDSCRQTEIDTSAQSVKRRKISQSTDCVVAPEPGLPRLLDDAVALLRRDECDAKLAGMILLAEHTPKEQLATKSALDILEREVISKPGIIDDWSTTDWFCCKVLASIWQNSGDHALALQILGFATIPSNGVFHRRMGVVPFVDWFKFRDRLPHDFGLRLVDACEANLCASPEERFTQTGVAWVLRYVLIQPTERDHAAAMIFRQGNLWSKEAKRSLAEKLPASDTRRKKILKY